eukprot:818587-Amphidinium_carterae.1
MAAWKVKDAMRAAMPSSIALLRKFPAQMQQERKTHGRSRVLRFITPNGCTAQLGPYSADLGTNTEGPFQADLEAEKCGPGAGCDMIATAAQMRYLKRLAQRQGAAIADMPRSISTASAQIDVWKRQVSQHRSPDEIERAQNNSARQQEPTTWGCS